MGKISIAIDGPASSGKSTVAKILAKQLNYVYCDTGAMYRAITYLALQNQIDIQAEEPLVALCVNHTISFQQAENGQRVFIDGHEVTEAIRQPDVTNAVSAVSKHAKVREENQEKGIETDFETLKAEIERRDYLDSTREVSPLVQASDAVKIDTTGLTIEEVVAAIQNVIKQKGFELF